MNRFELAWKILTGEMKLDKDGVFRCTKEHVAGGSVVIEKATLLKLEIAADDLKVARGVIAGMGKTKDYADMRDTTVGK
jgi:hypothetical protein